MGLTKELPFPEQGRALKLQRKGAKKPLPGLESAFSVLKGGRLGIGWPLGLPGPTASWGGLRQEPLHQAGKQLAYAVPQGGPGSSPTALAFDSWPLGLLLPPPPKEGCIFLQLFLHLHWGSRGGRDSHPQLLLGLSSALSFGENPLPPFWPQLLYPHPLGPETLTAERMWPMVVT